MSLSEHVRILGRGPGRSRSLSFDEARDAMGHMLAGDAAPEAVGALLMLMRMKGETADEIAGFTAAAQETVPGLPSVALDWPSYAAGRTRGLPWFLLSARLVAAAGYPVAIHGWNGPAEPVQSALPYAGIPLARTPSDAERMLRQGGVIYLPLETICPGLMRLLALREVLGLRSCVNTVCRMLNPTGAAAAVQGVFHPSYRQLQADAAQRLGLASLTVIKGGGGEFERHPGKQISAFGTRHGTPWQQDLPALMDQTRRLNDGASDPARLAALWSGALQDDFAEAVVIGTAALALDTLGEAQPEARAQALWAGRQAKRAA